MMRFLNRSCLCAVAFAGLSMLVSGCAHDDEVLVWTKPGVSEAQKDKDFSTCKRYADQDMSGRRGAQQDVEIMTGGVNSGVKPSVNGDISAYKDEKEYNATVRDCMVSAGYQPVK